MYCPNRKATLACGGPADGTQRALPSWPKPSATPTTAEALADEDGDNEGDDEGDDKNDVDDVKGNRYTRRWLNLPPLAIPPWPPALHAAVARARPPLRRVREMASARRLYLRRAYQFGGRVSRVGIRVSLTSESNGNAATAERLRALIEARRARGGPSGGVEEVAAAPRAAAAPLLKK